MAKQFKNKINELREIALRINIPQYTQQDEMS